MTLTRDLLLPPIVLDRALPVPRHRQLRDQLVPTIRDKRHRHAPALNARLLLSEAGYPARAVAPADPDGSPLWLTS